MTTGILKAMQEGRISYVSNELFIKDLSWHEHATFPGVALKHLITAKNTGGKFSCHLVRVNSGCEIGKHIHEGTWELHEVIQGHGKCHIENKAIAYYEGVISIVPPDTGHIVTAEEEDLYLLAKFIPAIV